MTMKKIPAVALPVGWGEEGGGAMAPLRILLLCQPHEFDDQTRNRLPYDGAMRPESDLEFYVRMAQHLIEFKEGGAPYLDSEEYTRIKAVWLDPEYIRREIAGELGEDEKIAPVQGFSVSCFAEIAKAEERIAARWKANLE